jgi:hypothetical protein
VAEAVGEALRHEEMSHLVQRYVARDVPPRAEADPTRTVQASVRPLLREVAAFVLVHASTDKDSGYQLAVRREVFGPLLALETARERLRLVIDLSKPALILALMAACPSFMVSPFFG